MKNKKIHPQIHYICYIYVLKTAAPLGIRTQPFCPRVRYHHQPSTEASMWKNQTKLNHMFPRERSNNFHEHETDSIWGLFVSCRPRQNDDHTLKVVIALSCCSQQNDDHTLYAFHEEVLTTPTLLTYTNTTNANQDSGPHWDPLLVVLSCCQRQNDHHILHGEVSRSFVTKHTLQAWIHNIQNQVHVAKYLSWANDHHEHETCFTNNNLCFTLDRSSWNAHHKPEPVVFKISYTWQSIVRGRTIIMTMKHTSQKQIKNEMKIKNIHR